MIASAADIDLHDATAFRASVDLMLRSLSGDALRRLATSRPTERSLAELIVAEAIAEALAEREGAEVPACSGTLLPFGRHDWHLRARAAA